MDSVRFSIIESDLKWNQKNEENLEGEEDNKSISSEGSVEGGTVDVSTIPNRQHNSPCEQEIWQSFEIDNSLKNLPNYEKIHELIECGDLDGLTHIQRDINTALLLAVWHQRPSCVVSLLNEFNADPNTSDLKGRTPLHLSCSRGDFFTTKVLLRHGAKSHQWDDSLKATPLHCAASAGSAECIQLLLRNGAQLNAGIERRSALHYAVERNIVHCVQILLQYGANPNTPQVYTETPLHVAASLGYDRCIKLLLDHGADVRSQFGKRRLTALHLAAEDDYMECVRLLLDAGAKIDVRNHLDQTPLILACLGQSTSTLEILIKRGADVHTVYKDGRTALHAAIVKDNKSWDCAKMLLRAGVDVNRPDNYGYTPVHLAALNEFSSCVHMLIEHGADITARTNGGVSALSFIVRRTPEVIPKYISKFDSSIKVNEHEIGDVDCEIKLDFRLLVPNNERGETELLLAFIEVGQKRILKHPLCETFLFLKWRRIRKFFLFSLFYHSIYVLLFTLYVLGVYVKDCPIASSSTDHCKIPPYIMPVGYLVLILNFLLLAKELFQMAHGFSSYVKYWENWLQWTIILGGFLCATPQAIISDDLTLVPKWQHHMAAVVIFLVWVELMMLVGRFPIFGLYVQMFTKVAVNFSKFLLAYCCLLVAFGLSFGVLFANYPAFKTIPWALLKTITMMAGELEFEDIFYDNERPLNYPVTAHAMFLAFVLLVTVILTNLLVGLAVSDIQGLQASAGLDRLSRQAELVSRLEGLFFSKLLRKLPPRLLAICQRSALLRTSRWHLQFCIKPNDPRERRLPKDLMLSVYKLVAERRDRNQSMKRKRNSQNYNLFKDSINDKTNTVQLRKHTSQLNSNPRPKTVAENSRIFYRNARSTPPPITLPQITDLDGDSNKSNVSGIVERLEKMEEEMSKRFDEINRDIVFIKMRMET
ncbi:transient receptor potential channel pyrexia [Phlebotomus argentipes]|uniref:transient receptor potential channel pyrexia n=1 Tax=Phlebotomus argentipes TaxID=94469 RepID=UPI0028930B97|nr:transient receptor potential channel pyrexia [Phlebotomus argentipes]XP_059610571.1 transient receptor potential channel pyrexia [Phlebotomus argentipes]